MIQLNLQSKFTQVSFEKVISAIGTEEFQRAKSKDLNNKFVGTFRI